MQQQSDLLKQQPSALTVRPATAADLLGVADLLVRGFRLYPPGGEWLIPVIRLGIQEDLRQRLQGRLYRCWVASLWEEPKQASSPQEISPQEISPQEILVGTVEVSQRGASYQFGPQPYNYLANLAVRSDYRQRGIAQALIQAGETQVRDWNCQDLYLHVMEDNFSARQLYLKAGYYIHQIENSWSSWLGLPQRLFLHKRL